MVLEIMIGNYSLKYQYKYNKQIIKVNKKNKNNKKLLKFKKNKNKN